MASNNADTVIIGAGIIGAAIAYNLAKKGDRPILIDKSVPAGGITGNSFGWLNAYNAENREYFDLRCSSMKEYEILAGELDPSFEINRRGSLVWDHGGIESVRPVERLQAWGYDIEIIYKHRIRQLEPGLKAPPPRACYAASESSVDPLSVTGSLVDAAIREGAQLKAHYRVTGVRIDNSRITAVETDSGTIRCSTIIVAAGHGTGTICRAAGFEVPANTSEALLVKTQRLEPVVNGLLSAPGVRLWQARDGSVLACDDFDGSNLASRAEELAVNLMERANRLVKFSEPVMAGRIMFGRRLLPGDGMPVIGESATVRGCYLALMHSGITLAPLVGRLIAGEIVSGREEPLLRPYRPARFGSAA